MSDDVKELLGRAFGQEPPLGIDRDEVLREGRKRLRRRRYFASGGVMAAVVVAAVGAATLTNLTDTSAPDRMPPAASSTLPTPPTTLDTPVSERPLPPAPEGSSTPPKPLTASWAQALTGMLYSSGHVREELVSPVKGEPKAAFRVAGDKYLYMADTFGPKGSGFVEFTVEYARGYVPDCGYLATEYQQCEVFRKKDVNVVVARQWADDTGEVVSYALAVLPDGSLITARASNLTSVSAKTGAPPADPAPPLDDDALCDILVKSGLRVS